MPGPLMQLQGHGYYLSGKYNCGRFCAGCKNCKNDKEEAEDKNASAGGGDKTQERFITSLCPTKKDEHSIGFLEKA